ncbi:MAG: hypothetical protein HY720_22350 [Planctomycetes bacterium]|nr:hypothetical protein [Planctomycetota bacterium]
MRDLLLVYFGPAGYRREVALRHGDALRDLGYRLLLANDFIEEEDHALFDEIVELPPPERVGEAVRALERYAASREVGGVLVQTEAGLLPGALLAERLGLRSIGLAAAHASANKLLTRQLLARAGVPQPAFALVSDAAGVRRFADGEGRGYPVVLKAVASTMGRLVTRVARDEDVEDGVRRVAAGLPRSPDVARLLDFGSFAGLDPGCDPAREFLVESFAPGRPVETDGLVIGREPRTVGVTEQMPSPYGFYIDGYLLPADRPPGELAAIRRVSDGAIRALGLSNSGFSIEMRAQGDSVRAIEVNARLGEDDGFAELFRAATGGEEPIRLALELAAGLAPSVLAAAGPRWALAYRSNFRAGVVRTVPSTADLARARASGVKIGLAVWPGASLQAPGHPEFFPHLAWALASDPTSSRAAYERAHSALEGVTFGIEAP